MKNCGISGTHRRKSKANADVDSKKFSLWKRQSSRCCNRTASRSVHQVQHRITHSEGARGASPCGDFILETRASQLSTFLNLRGCEYLSCECRNVTILLDENVPLTRTTQQGIEEDPSKSAKTSHEAFEKLKDILGTSG